MKQFQSKSRRCRNLSGKRWGWPLGEIGGSDSRSGRSWRWWRQWSESWSNRFRPTAEVNQSFIMRQKGPQVTSRLVLGCLAAFCATNFKVCLYTEDQRKHNRMVPLETILMHISTRATTRLPWEYYAFAHREGSGKNSLSFRAIELKSCTCILDDALRTISPKNDE